MCVTCQSQLQLPGAPRMSDVTGKASEHSTWVFPTILLDRRTWGTSSISHADRCTQGPTGVGRPGTAQVPGTLSSSAMQLADSGDKFEGLAAVSCPQCGGPLLYPLLPPETRITVS